MEVPRTITVLTPTYNRAYLLEQLYSSLIVQTSHDFQWFVMDDGSTDHTGEIVEGFMKEEKIKIIYSYQDNGGKHKALNTALKQITTELVFIVDSDDYLTEDACEVILNYHKKYRGNKLLCGYSFLRKYPDGKINNAEFPEDELLENYIECRVNRSIGGDKAEVFLTGCLREFPFPEFPGERFLNEDVVWIKMAGKYRMVHINRAIYIGNYLKDGITRKGKRLKAENPLGGMERGKAMMSPECKLSIRIKGALQYAVFGWFAKRKTADIVGSTVNRQLTLLCLPFAYAIYTYYRICFYSRGANG
ncbi:MAG TPA: glycosyltransferase family 2 protein [Clostridiales bacterium]|nr:glycosyltransferase family 2 protein [Clostridiales bacterium]